MASPRQDNVNAILWTDRKLVAIEASEMGLVIRSLAPKIFNPAVSVDWSKISSPIAIRNFGIELPSLLQNKFVEAEGNNLFISIASLYELVTEEVPLISRVIRLCPLSLHIRSESAPGQGAFSLHLTWYNGLQAVYPKLVGPFVAFRGNTYLLEEAQFQSVKVVNALNDLPADERTKERAFRAIAELHKNRELSDISLDDFLAQSIVIEPQKVGVGIQREGSQALSLYPVFQNVEPEAMRAAFLQQGDVEGVYDLPRSEGGRVRVLLSEDIQEVLKDLQKARHVSGERAKRIEEAPTSVLREGANWGVLDESFSPRVIGLTDIPVSQLSRQETNQREWFANAEEEEDDDNTDGEQAFSSPSADYVIDDPAQLFKPTYRHLEILTNEESVDFEEGARGRRSRGQALPSPKLPDSLVSSRLNDGGDSIPFSLKQHQRVGVSWLQELYQHRDEHKGCLLADDMGLGKTLQLLTFFASVLEGKVGYQWPEIGPYEPILVVAPMILFENWEREIRTFFSPSPFGVVLTLHGSQIKRMRRPDTGDTHELRLEESVLDLERIRQYRIVVTNYDTVRNYQHSFLKMQWSIVVADEAQEIKAQSVTSKALKALKARFKIAVTGTPVENRLLDLWNIVDFVQPGTLLDSAAEFRSKFETPMASEDAETRTKARDSLRELLGYNTPRGAILRRDKKSELKDLPPKEIRKIECALTAEELALYLDLRQRVDDVTGRGAHLSFVANDLKALFNHPRLYKRDFDFSNPAALITESPKLQALVKLLKDVRRQGEKVLIFSDRRPMQTILAEVVQLEFGFRPTIINSLTGTGSAGSERARANLIKEFERAEGFNVIVLSPMCAGVGLTITGANHVVHYGRWWNPAVENQATDRAYRIGQNRPVFVYHLIARDESGQVFRTFDQILDELLTSKSGLAEDFLTATAQCEVSEADVFAEMRKNAANSSTGGHVFKQEHDVAALDPHVFEEVCGLHLEKQGFSTVIAPRSDDGGLDILAWNKEELRLIQCKHSSNGGKILDDAIEQILGAEQTFQHELGKVKGRRKCTLAVMTNGKLPLGARCRAKQRDVTIIQRRDLWRGLSSTPMTYSELGAYRVRRCRNRKEFLAQVARVIP